MQLSLITSCAPGTELGALEHAHAYRITFPQKVNILPSRLALAATAREHSKEIIELTKALLRIPSAYPTGNTHAVSAAIVDMFEGVEVEAGSICACVLRTPDTIAVVTFPLLFAV